MTTANNLEALANKALGGAPDGLPDVQDLSRLANQLFGQIQCDGSRLQGLTQVASKPDIISLTQQNWLNGLSFPSTPNVDKTLLNQAIDQSTSIESN